MPCGITDKRVTLAARASASDVTVDEMADRVQAAMAEVLVATLEPASLDALLPSISKVAS